MAGSLHDEDGGSLMVYMNGGLCTGRARLLPCGLRTNHVDDNGTEEAGN